MVALTIVFILMVLSISGYVWFVATDKRWAIIAMALLYVGTYWAWGSVQGWPKFIALPNEEVPVLAYSLDENVAIYIWVQEGEPRAYRLPWDMETAKQLRRAGQQAEQQGGRLMMRRKGFPEGDRIFYPEPVKELPPKT